MCIFLKKSIKSPLRQGIRPRTSVGLRRLGALPLDPRFVFNTKDFNRPYSYCFNIRYSIDLIPLLSVGKATTHSVKTYQKNDGIFLFEQVA